MKRGLGYYVRSVGFSMKMVSGDTAKVDVQLPCQIGPKGRYIVPEITAIEVQWPHVEMPYYFSDTAASEFHGSMLDSLLFRVGRGTTEVGIQLYDQLKEATCIDTFARGIAMHEQIASVTQPPVAQPVPFALNEPRSCFREVHDLAKLGNGEGKVLASGHVQITGTRYVNFVGAVATPEGSYPQAFGDYLYGRLYFRMRLLNMAEYQFIQAKTNNQAVSQEDVKWSDNDVALAYIAPNPTGTVWATPTM